MSKEVLEELRAIVGQDEAIPQRQVSRLVIAGMIEIADALSGTNNAIHIYIEETRQMTSDLKEDNRIINERLNNLEETVKCFVADNTVRMTGLEANILVRLGKFIKDNPKTTRVIAAISAVIVLLLSNMWFISGFRRAIMLWLGIPKEIVDILSP